MARGWSDQSDQLLSLCEAARFARSSQKALRCAVLRGEVASEQKDRYQFLKSTVAAWIEEQRYQDPPNHGSWQRTQLAAFLDRGFLHVPHALRGAKLRALQMATECLIERATARKKEIRAVFRRGADGAPVLERILESEMTSVEICSLLAHDLVVRAAMSLLGKRYIVYNASLVVKVPSEGIEVKAHRDPTWTTRIGADPVFSIGFYLDDSDVSNGGVYFLPQTHRVRFGRATDLPCSNIVVAEQATWPKISAGDAILHNLGVIHGSLRNDSAALRRTVYVSVMSLSEARKCGRWTSEWIVARRNLMRRLHTRGS